MKKTLMLSAAAATILSASAYAEEVVKLETIDVVGIAEQYESGSSTVPSNALAGDLMRLTPGGVALVPSETYEDKYTINFEDTLAQTPGVYAQKRFGEEVRISIRGSGLSRGFHLRGLDLLQDGIPFNLADGSADFQEADTLATQRIEVYKGSNALQYGGKTLGGAVNMVTKTGRSNPGNQIRLEAGSDNTFRANYQMGKVIGDSDLFASITRTSSDGFRQHGDQDNIKLNVNFGRKISDTVETRFYISGNDIEQSLPGSVSLASALNTPKLAGAGVVASDQARDMKSVRLSNKTTFKLDDGGKLDVGAFFNRKDLYHPITPFVGLIDQASDDYGVFAQRSGIADVNGYANHYRYGVTTHFGTVDAKLFANVGGKKGAQTADSDYTSGNAILYGENHFYFRPEWALVTGGQLIWSNREAEDNFTPAESDSDSYTAFNPKLGLLYEPKDNLQFFTNISRSYEVPTFSELTQAGTVGFTPVNAQKAWTFEIGSRGEEGIFDWDVSLYRAWLQDEMLQYSAGGGIPAPTFNADDTIHQGVELGLGIDLAQSIFGEGDRLKLINSYTFSDYYFEGDVQFGDNDIPGQPKHFYQAELRYDYKDIWHVAPNVEYASDADVDFANTLEAPDYTIFGVSAGYNVNESVSFFMDGRNLTNEKYVSTFSTITNPALPGVNANVFYPGDGRSVFAGVRIKF